MDFHRLHGIHENDRVDMKELHIAPMLNVSTIEFRNFMRILTKRCVIWTEMIVDETIYYSRHTNDNVADVFCGTCDDNTKLRSTVPQHLLPPVLELDHPIVCQIGGIRPEWTAVATKFIVQAGYNRGEINLNLDCPSTRVQGKQFGAVLMKDVPRTMDLIQAIRINATSKNIRVSVKCRIGIVDDETDLEWIIQLVKELSSVCTRFVIHARAVVLHGLSPSKNRSVPPLNYPVVYQLCNLFPHCDFIINGGIPDLKSAKDICYGTNVSLSCHQHAVPCELCNHISKNGSCVTPPSLPAPQNLRGCMLGRAAVENPVQFAVADRYWYGVSIASDSVSTRRHIIEKYCQYLDRTYPRRCCDDYDTIMTHEFPSPTVTPSYPYCSICKEFQLSISSCAAQVQWDRKPSELVQRNVKIATRIIDRALKPVLGLFYQQDGSKKFRRHCDLLSRDPSIRNCGPALILYQAVKLSISSHVLDRCVFEEFLSLDDLII